MRSTSLSESAGKELDKARHVSASASLLWAQRHNPPWLDVSTFVGAFKRVDGDVHAWESTDRHWAAELRRAARGQHVYLALWRDRIFVGTYDERRGWQPARTTRSRRSSSVARQLAFAS